MFGFRVWQHVDCMGIDRNNIPDEYLCEKCQPRRTEKQKAIALQLRKKKELLDTSDSSSDSSSGASTLIITIIFRLSFIWFFYIACTQIIYCLFFLFNHLMYNVSNVSMRLEHVSSKLHCYVKSRIFRFKITCCG